MRVVYDTNVVVSSFLSSHGAPAKVIKAWKNEIVDVVVSEAILSEYRKVLSYQRIQKLHRMTDQEIEDVINNFRKFAYVVMPKKTITVIEEDPDDNKFLECAEEGEALYVVSGDQDLLKIGQYSGIQILTPSIFLSVIVKEISKRK